MGVDPTRSCATFLLYLAFSVLAAGTWTGSECSNTASDATVASRRANLSNIAILISTSLSLSGERRLCARLCSGGSVYVTAFAGMAGFIIKSKAIIRLTSMRARGSKIVVGEVKVHVCTSPRGLVLRLWENIDKDAPS